MRLIIVNSLNFGGLERNVYDLVKNYPKKFMVVCINENGFFGLELEKLNFKVFCLKGNKINKIFQLRQIIKKYKIRIIVSENTAPMQLSVLSSIFLKVKRIHVDHNSFAEGVSKIVKLENFFYSKFIKRFITITEDVKDKMSKSWFIKKSKIKVIPNGIDINEIIEKSKGKIQNFPNVKGKIITIVGGLRKIKNHQTLLKAFRGIDKNKVNLILLGDGPMRNKIIKIIKDLELKNVFLLGTREDYLKIIKKSDIIVNSSLSEGLSIALLEAMTLKKPIIATAVGGNLELVKGNGFLFKRKDYVKLNEHINKLLKDKKLRLNMSNKSYALVKEKYTIEKMIEEYVKCVE